MMDDTRLDLDPVGPAGREDDTPPRRPSTRSTTVPADGVPAADLGPADDLVGRVVADRYHVVAAIASGGIGRVFRARQAGLDRDIALKLLHPELAADPAQKARFHREARAASLLRHPSAVAIHDFGEWEGRLYIAMELVTGWTLSEIVDRELPLSPRTVVDILVPVCEVLHEAHHAGLVHRDIKPPNIMVEDPGPAQRVKLLDFGLVRSRQFEKGPDDRLTPSDLIAGTPAYMAPEQVRGQEVDARSDLYALGVVLYEMLCGRRPFDASSPADLMVQHLFSTPDRPSDVRPDFLVDQRLEALALQALAKRPEDRPASALAFRDALRAAVDPALPPLHPGSDRPDRLAIATDRLSRSRAAGIATVAAPADHLAAARAARSVVVVERPAAFAQSLTALLRARGYVAQDVEDVDTGLALAPHAGAFALVVDLRQDVAAGLDLLAARISDGATRNLPLVVVGPKDDLAPMSRAIEIGVRDWVPDSSVDALLPRALDRILRRARPASPSPD